MPDTVWLNWTNGGTSSTTSYDVTNAVWTIWVGGTTTGASNVVDTVWTTWVNGSNSAAYVYAPPVESPEQVAARQAAWREEEAKRAAERERSRARAVELLRDHLSRHQVRQLDRHGHFTVEGSNGGRYLIERGTHGNVYCLARKGRKWVKKESLCIQPGGVPDEDANLAQKLMIEADEAAFRRTANIRQLLH